MATANAALRTNELRLDTDVKDFASTTTSQTQYKDDKTVNNETDTSRRMGQLKNSDTEEEAIVTVQGDDYILEPHSYTAEEVLSKRRPSINFSPEVTLDCGHRQSMGEPLQKPVKVRPRGRSLLQAMSDEKSRRAHSESHNTHYDAETGQPLQKYAVENRTGTRTLHVGESRHPLLQTTIDEMARGSQRELTNSLTSQSTLSPSSDEVRTPHENKDFLVSPTSLSPRPHATSYEDLTPWQRDRPDMDRAYSVSEIPHRAGSLRIALRQSSQRSTSSSAKSPQSAASSWLRAFSIGSAPDGDRTEPGSEGQTIGDDYVIGRQIGFGGFSTIHEVTQMDEAGAQRKLAAKVVRKTIRGRSTDENEQFQAEFGHEVELWRMLHHRHVLPLETVVHTEEATYCFIPLNVGGTLLDLVRSNQSGVPTALAKGYSYQLASALHYLHRDARVAHRDVKLENCLLDTTVDPAEVRLCDFGMAEWISSDDSSNGSGPPSPSINAADRPPQRNIGPAETSSLAFAGGSLEYAAPEILRAAMSKSTERAPVSPAVDLWAYGVCVYTMVAGARPFNHHFESRTTTAILAGRWDRDRLLVRGGQDTLDLVQGCLAMEAEKRWDTNQVLQCAWLKEIADASADQDDSLGSEWKL